MLCDFEQFVKANIEINFVSMAGLCAVPVALRAIVCLCDYAAFDLIYLCARLALIYADLCCSLFLEYTVHNAA